MKMALAAMSCGIAIACAPLAHAAPGEVLDGSFILIANNGDVIDRWEIDPDCNGDHPGLDPNCSAIVTGSEIKGVANYVGGYYWNMTIQGKVPICPSGIGHSPQGIMIFEWNSKSRMGQVTMIALTPTGTCADMRTNPGALGPLQFRIVDD